MRKISFLLVFLTTSLFCQKNKHYQKLFKVFDSIVNIQNTDLSYGKVYENAFKTTSQSHQFYKLNQFTKGSIIYQNQPFFDVFLLYDLYNDEVVVQLDQNKKQIVLENAAVTTFSIFNKTFNNFPNIGFLEILHQSKTISFYQKHSKKKKKKFDKSTLYYKFIENNTFYFMYKNTLHEIKNKNSIVTILPEHKKSINDFYKLNKNLLKKDSKRFFTLLSKQLQHSNKDTQ